MLPEDASWKWRKYKTYSRFDALQLALAVLIGCGFVGLNSRIQCGQKNDFSLESRRGWHGGHIISQTVFIFLVYNVSARLDIWEIMPFGILNSIFVKVFGKMLNIMIVSPQIIVMATTQNNFPFF